VYRALDGSSGGRGRWSGSVGKKRRSGMVGYGRRARSWRRRALVRRLNLKAFKGDKLPVNSIRVDLLG
jgi:hypothetical protein